MSRPETMRQAVHIAMGGFAFALRDLTWQQAALFAALAFVFNVTVLPRIGHRLFRSRELESRLTNGVVLYPLAVFLLVVVFRGRPDIAAASWAILAAGDGSATLVGRRAGTAALPWNPEKTWAGSAAFVAAGGVAATVLLWWTREAAAAPPPLWFELVAPWIAAIVAALVESLPVSLDDNLSVPVAAAATLWTVSMIDPAAVASSWPLAGARLRPALAVNGLAAFMAYRFRSVTRGGAAAGLIVGTLIWMGTGIAGWLLLGVTFVTAVVASRAGLTGKIKLGIAEGRGGRRGVGNTIANCGLATVAALLTLWTAHAGVPWLAFVTALTAAASDTASSEIGKAAAGRTFSVTTWRPVPPGTSGGISLAGTGAGVATAVLMALLATWVLGLLPLDSLWIVVFAGFLESVVGATLEATGVLNNDVVNFLNTAAAASTAVLVRHTLP